MIVIKNIQFSCNIKAADRLREFNFRKLQSTSDPVYQIDVSDERGNRHFFSMQLVGSEWKIRGALVAHWIVSAEQALHEAIEQQEAQI
jgi:hypothetical protein